MDLAHFLNHRKSQYGNILMSTPFSLLRKCILRQLNRKHYLKLSSTSIKDLKHFQVFVSLNFTIKPYHKNVWAILLLPACNILDPLICILESNVDTMKKYFSVHFTITTNYKSSDMRTSRGSFIHQELKQEIILNIAWCFIGTLSLCKILYSMRVSYSSLIVIILLETIDDSELSTNPILTKVHLQIKSWNFKVTFSNTRITFSIEITFKYSKL